MTNSANDIRRSFLASFERHQHRVVPSSPLVPHNDPTLLFTNAGMNQFKDVFLGKEKRDYTRAASAQKCMRVSGKHNDLENVGPSLRHHTFFEMLGNFSFGDYFKKDAIPFAWTLLTEEWKIPADRLFATVFAGDGTVPRDDEAYDIWRKFLPADRIGELGAADNFWQMGDTGPCGRCSEIYYYRSSNIPCEQEPQGGCRGLECSCDRYIEIWNNVFMEFDRQPNGTLKSLPAPSIDTGMGLERITAVLQGQLSNYDTDLFTPLLASIGERAGGITHGGTMAPADVSMRVVADHMRAMTFLIADGVVPSNEWRGYVLRKIMRRAMRHGKRLGMTEPFLHVLVDTLVRDFGGAYPELKTNRDAVVQVIRTEEERFDAVLVSGLPRLEEVLDRAAAGDGLVPGDAAFKLYDTYGLPRDFIEDMIDERKLRLDTDSFEKSLEGQRHKARAKSKFGTAPGGDSAEWQLRPSATALAERFTGYDTVSGTGQIVELLDAHRRPVDQLGEGQDGFIVLPDTPFYLQSGGQVSDVGRITAPAGEAIVTDVIKGPPDVPRFHAVTVTRGVLHFRDLVSVEVDRAVRDATRRNHTATHLLHAALREVLGGHVKQAGSLVAPDRLRFDFVHFGPVTPEQQLEIERIVNEQVLANNPVQTDVKNTQEAIAAGAMALFGEKYGDRVRVVSVPGFSVELCGGTHVRATGDIGLFAIVSEGGVAAGVRRIEAITGLDSVRAFQHDRAQLAGLASALNARPAELVPRIKALQDDSKRLARELQQARMQAAMGGDSAGGPGDDAIEVAGIKLVAREVAGVDKDGLRALVDQHRSRIKSGVVILAAPSDGKVTVVVGVTPDLTKKIPAGQVVKQIAPIVGGGGGGRPDFAEAGGKDPSKIGEMLTASRAVIEKMLLAVLLVILSLGTAGAQARGQAEPPEEIPPHLVYVPMNVAERMLRDAAVTKGDLVYDLGCGDGRVSILAVKQFGADAVCVENNAKRMAEAKDNATKEGVAGRIMFLQQTSADLTKATVVTMSSPQSMTWLGMNGLLNPTLTSQLRPGARLISNFVPGSIKGIPPVKVDHFTDPKGTPISTLFMWTRDRISIPTESPKTVGTNWVFRDVAQPNFYLRNPEFVDVSKASFLKDNDRVLGVTGDGVAKAYPAPAITWHHGIEDRLGSTPIFVTWCNECNTGMIYKALINGKPATFYHTNMVNQNMTFADAGTKTRWQQQTGEGIDGPLKGQHLEYLPYTLTTWKEWRTRNPKTLVMQPVPGFDEFYAAMWSVIAWRTPDKAGPDRIAKKDPRLAVYEPVVGLAAGGARRGYPRGLLKQEQLVNDQMGTEPVLVIYAPASDTVTSFSRRLDGRTLTFTRPATSRDIVDAETNSRWNTYGEALAGPLKGKRLTGILGIPQFWYAWSSFGGETDVYAGKGQTPR